MPRKTDRLMLSGKKRLFGLTVLLSTVAMPAAIHADRPPSFNLYGVPGLVDMPTAEVAPDGTISTTVAGFGDNARTTLSFQITPRLSGSFRYSAISNFNNPASVNGNYYDRSFDLRYQILTESRYRPSVLIGLQDFIGTGLYGGEYIVATKEVARGLRLTGGIGWGRLGSANPFGTTGTRPDELLGEGGLPTYDRWFRGDVSAFGGISYSPNDQLTFNLEYSSDNYDQERRDGGFAGSSQWNLGLDYRLRNGTQFTLYHAYGEEIGAQVTFHLDPRAAPVPGGTEAAPVPVAVRAAGSAEDLGWTTDAAGISSTRQTLAEAMARENLVYEGMDLEARRVTVRLRNPTYGRTAQAMGRTARVLSRVMPASVEEFVIVPTVNGMPVTKVELRRSSVEALENEAAAEMLARTRITDAYRAAPPVEPGLYPRFAWALEPYIQLSVFDPDNPVRADAGARLRASYRIAPNVVLSGSMTKKAVGNLDSITRIGTSGLPFVRTELRRYSKEGDPALEYLTLDMFGRPGPDLYSRLTFGYLEKMYAGVSGEILWKPVDSRLALGAELNYVQPRDFDQLFGLRSRTTGGGEIPTVNGHLSAYYDFGNGFHGQMDVGRYLAGDWGTTLTLDREFANGWRVGAYATFTNVEFDDFGEGSFDKGIRLTIPFDWVIGSPSRRSNDIRIQSLTRDGGARLDVQNRLYGQVRDYHRPEMTETWGRFWR